VGTPGGRRLYGPRMLADAGRRQLTPWGFDVAQIPVPVLLLHGGRDSAVPFSHGQWLASHIPGAETWFFAAEGHTLRERHIEDVHAWLVDRDAGRSSPGSGGILMR
jgi:pimeloyl-ACP methyl ester carboxylesterase